MDRIAALAREIAPLVGADPAQAEQAARLSKADLASGMVGEFPELQGIMGGYYARLAGQPDAVADAIRDHYKPQGPGDTVPTAPVTVAVAMAEKLDTLVGFFAIDEKPTGSKDPYALRRAALGVLRLDTDNGVGLELRGNSLLFDHLRRMKGFEGVDYVRAAPLLDALTFGFLSDRLEVMLRDRGIAIETVRAAFGRTLSGFKPVSLVESVEALAAFLATDDGANLLAGYKRAAQLLKAEEKKGPLPYGAVATGLPNQPAEETALAFAAAAAASAVDAALEAEDFAAAMTALAALRGPVDAFFTAVMVNSDVAEERENRLKLLVQVRGVMNRVADFGQIAG